jgi:hypothetical protein
MAFVVTAGSIVLAILWAVCDIRRGARRPARPGE